MSEKKTAAPQVSSSIGSTTRNQAEPVPAAAPSKLPLSAEQIEDWRIRLTRGYLHSLCNQALHAIELERDFYEYMKDTMAEMNRLEAELATARREERERCAKICDGWDQTSAKRIRALEDEK